MIGGGNSLSSSYSTSSVTGNNEVGGFTGSSNGNKFNNCYSTGDVLGNDYVGGFVGYGGGKINNCYSTSNVVGNDNVGGFVGSSYTKYFNNYSTGDVLGNNNVGGFVGIVDGYGYIYNNYTTSNVSGNNNVGGFVGSATNKIINNYSWGDVTRISGSSENYFGGFAGYRDDSGHSGQMANNYSIGKVIYEGTDNPTDKGFMGYSDGGCLGDGNNYWDMNTSEQTTSAGDAEGKTTDELTYPYDVFTFPGWDFPSVWRIDTTNVNGGYPYLYWQDIGTLADTQISTSFCSEDVNIDSQGRYIIDNAIKLDCVRNRLSGNFILGADINLEGIEFEPIGGLGTDSANAFRGTFDGAGYKISNLYINQSGQSQVGLFGYALNATISNLGLEDINVIGENSVGGLVGELRYSTISNNYSVGIVTGSANVGGLIGDNENGVISNNYSVGIVTGSANVGGLIGDNENGVISNNYSAGSVSGTYYVGGLVGYNNNQIYNSYSSGSVSCPSDVGGLVGYNGSRGRISNSFYDSYFSGQSDTGKGDPIFVSQMLKQSTFTDWDFSTIWGIEEDTSYPYLKSNEQIPHPLSSLYVGIFPEDYYFNTTADITFVSNGSTIYYTTNSTDPNCIDAGILYSSPITITEDTTIKAIACQGEQSTSVITKIYYLFDVSGSGTEEDPYILFTQRDLNVVLRNNLSAYFELGQDIDLNVSPYNEGEGWEPIGDNSYPFNGDFDGTGYTISNLYINRPETDNQGLFGVTLSATLTDINLENVSVSGTGNNIGSLVGYNDYTTILNCSSSGSVSSSGWYIGGLVGYNNYGTISNSSSNGSVSGTNWWDIGGLVGINSGTITESFSNGTISGTHYIGGLVGANNSTGTITKSFSSGSVSGVGEIGGLVGINSGTITKSFSSNSVSTGTIVGGLVGANIGSGTMTENFSSGSVSGTGEVGGFVGQYNSSNGSISNNYSLGNVTRSSGSNTTYFGGFIGRFYSGTLTNNYSKGRVIYAGSTNPTDKGFSGTEFTGSGNFWDMNTSLQTTSCYPDEIGMKLICINNGATGKTTTEMMTQSTFTDWDFTNIWDINAGTTYPYLRNNIQSPLPE